jgi:hypothetical protein
MLPIFGSLLSEFGKDEKAGLSAHNILYFWNAYTDFILAYWPRMAVGGYASSWLELAPGVWVWWEGYKSIDSRWFLALITVKNLVVWIREFHTFFWKFLYGRHSRQMSHQAYSVVYSSQSRSHLGQNPWRLRFASRWIRKLSVVSVAGCRWVRKR